MSESTNPVTPNATTPCACNAPKAQPAAAPAATQPAAAPAAPKAKRNRKAKLQQ